MDTGPCHRTMETAVELKQELQGADKGRERHLEASAGYDHKIAAADWLASPELEKYFAHDWCETYAEHREDWAQKGKTLTETRIRNDRTITSTCNDGIVWTLSMCSAMSLGCQMTCQYGNKRKNKPAKKIFQEN